jgi:hypothetical protein
VIHLAGPSRLHQQDCTTIWLVDECPCPNDLNQSLNLHVSIRENNKVGKKSLPCNACMQSDCDVSDHVEPCPLFLQTDLTYVIEASRWVLTIVVCDLE